MKVPN